MRFKICGEVQFADHVLNKHSDFTRDMQLVFRVLTSDLDVRSADCSNVYHSSVTLDHHADPVPINLWGCLMVCTRDLTASTAIREC